MNKTQYMAELKYKVGDRVRIKSIDWYNENKNKYGNIICGYMPFTSEMSIYCGEALTICDIKDEFSYYHMKKCEYMFTDEMIEGLVERNGKTYPYKIGDRVILKGKNRCATITDLKYNSQGNLSYYIKIDNDKDISIDYPTDLLLPYDNMIECKVEEETKSHNNMCKQLIDEMNPNVEYVTETHRGYYTTEPETTIEGKKRGVVYFWDNDFADKVELDLSDRELIQEDGKWFVVKKKKEYPKTYEECCYVLGLSEFEYNHTGTKVWYRHRLMATLDKLILCRNAYWKIAGEKMGLGKPWEPTMETVYCISRNNNVMKCSYRGGKSNILEFPTEEMRDSFKENFDPDIEICKEVL